MCVCVCSNLNTNSHKSNNCSLFLSPCSAYCSSPGIRATTRQPGTRGARWSCCCGTVCCARVPRSDGVAAGCRCAVATGRRPRACRFVGVLCCSVCCVVVSFHLACHHSHPNRSAVLSVFPSPLIKVPPPPAEYEQMMNGFRSVLTACTSNNNPVSPGRGNRSRATS